MVLPGKTARINDDATNGSAVTTKIFGQGMHDNISAKGKGLAQIGCGNRIVYHQGNAILMGNIGK